MASVLYLVNNTTQTVTTDQVINPGFVKHRSCGSQAMLNGNVINISGSGYFVIDVNTTFTAPIAGNITVSLYKDGILIPGATATETVTTATTQFRSISYSVEILNKCCDANSSITLVNNGDAADFTNVTVRVKRDA